MTHFDPMALYRQEYIDKDFERLDLFVELAERYKVQSALYPGSFVHITPSFVFPTTVYVDSDKRAKRFFALPLLEDIIAQRKAYEQAATVRFYGQSYTDDIEEPDTSFDLLISQWAGFISRHCNKYLKVGGHLLANNSHGDVSMASFDPHFELVAIVQRRDSKHRISERNLESDLIPKLDKEITQAHVEKTMRGIAYQKTASMYIFKRIG